MLFSAAASTTTTTNRYFAGNDDYSIETTNHPLPLPASFKADSDLQDGASVAFTINLLLGFGMAFMIATFVVFLIRVRTCTYARSCVCVCACVAVTSCV